MKKTKLLFVINSLRAGGAEKVMVNLVNNLDREKYDITVFTLFAGGVNKLFLRPDVKVIEHYCKAPKGFVYICKLFSPKTLYKHFIKEEYDVVIPYLQGICTRIVAGAPDGVKKIAWVHSFMKNRHHNHFRSMSEMVRLYRSYDKVACVSEHWCAKVKEETGVGDNAIVVYNTHDVKGIMQMSQQPVAEMEQQRELKIVAIGTLYYIKGFDRLLRCLKKLKDEGLRFHMYFVGDGEQHGDLAQYVKDNAMTGDVIFYGYQKNPYQYMSKADLFVCSSISEGFSGTVSEATILGIPTLTTRCSGMDEILGKNNEYGIIVENNEEALYEGLKDLMINRDKLALYKEKVKDRSSFFSTESTVHCVEKLIDTIVNNK